MLARSKLNSIEGKMSEALIVNKISNEDFITIINDEECCQELKENIRMIKIQTSDTEKNYLVEEGKQIGIDKIIKRNEIFLFEV